MAPDEFSHFCQRARRSCVALGRRPLAESYIYVEPLSGNSSRAHSMEDGELLLLTKSTTMAWNSAAHASGVTYPPEPDIDTSDSYLFPSKHMPTFGGEFSKCSHGQFQPPAHLQPYDSRGQHFHAVHAYTNNCFPGRTTMDAHSSDVEDVCDSCDDTSAALRCYVDSKNTVASQAQAQLRSQNRLGVRRGASPHTVSRGQCGLRRTARGGLIPPLLAPSQPSQISSPRYRRVPSTTSPIPVPAPSPSPGSQHNQHHRNHHHHRNTPPPPGPDDFMASSAPRRTPPPYEEAIAASACGRAAGLPPASVVNMEHEVHPERSSGAPSGGSGDGGSATLRAIMRYYDAAREERARRPPGVPMQPQRVVLGFPM